METSRDGSGLIEVIRDDHQQIKTMLEPVRTGMHADAFQQLVAKLAVHETAEEEVVHPLTRNAPGGEPVVEQRLEEEDKGKKALAELEKMGVDDPRFPAGFEQLRTEVLAHAQHEEQEEHPKLAQSVDQEKLRSLAKVFPLGGEHGSDARALDELRIGDRQLGGRPIRGDRGPGAGRDPQRDAQGQVLTRAGALPPCWPRLTVERPRQDSNLRLTV
jgi:Hemerythrin HHE cation binding domain